MFTLGTDTLRNAILQFQRRPLSIENHLQRTSSSAGGAPHCPATSSSCRRFSAAAGAPAVPPSSPVPASNTGSSSSSSSNGKGRASWTRALLVIPPAVAALLGKWQLDRRQWKIDLLERRKRMMQGEPVDIFSDDAIKPEEYQRVRAVGQFDHSKSVFVGPRPRSSMGTTERGYLVITPLRNSTKNGRTILVLRGWVPDAWSKEDPAVRAAEMKHDEATHTVCIQGVVRGGEVPGTFVPENIPSKGSWFYIDPPALAAAAGLPPGTPLVEVVANEEGTRLVSPGGPPTAMEVLGGRGSKVRARASSLRAEESYPLAKTVGDMMAFSVMPRDHMNYAATWFTLAGATALLAVKALRGGGRVRRKVSVQARE